MDRCQPQLMEIIFFFSIREDKKYYKINTKYHIAVLTINIQDVKRSR